MALSIYINSDNLVVIDGVYDTLGLLTDAEILAATGAVTLYSDAAHQNAVSGASSLAIAAIPGQTAATHPLTNGPFRFYATIPNTVSLTKGTQYYAVGSLTATDVSESQASKIEIEEAVVATWKS